MGVWDGVERYERRHMELETHQVREEENHKRLVSRFPHFPSWPPPDDNLALGPTWHLRTPPTLTNAHHFEHEPTILGVSPSFQMWPHCLEHKTIVSNVSLSFWISAHHFECEPVILNVSLSLWTWACCFKCQPVVLSVSPSFRMWARHFECQPVVSNASPSFPM